MGISVRINSIYVYVCRIPDEPLQSVPRKRKTLTGNRTKPSTRPKPSRTAEIPLAWLK
jgi:hypothetical protein